MTTRSRLVGMRNEELLNALSLLVRRGIELTSDLLAHLAEVDERRLHLDLGFPSLFAYCTRELGLCESSAGRRIVAARVCRKFSGALERVARGELHLSALCALNAHLNRENAAELFALCSGKSRRQVDELLAARFPKPDVRESIRRLPNRVEVERSDVACAAQVQDQTLRPLSAERFGVHFTADAEFRDLLERANFR
jgi:hypothetical protein